MTASIWLAAFTPLNPNNVYGPGLPILPDESGGTQQDELCEDLSQEYSTRLLACSNAAIKTNPALMEWVAQPGYLLRTDTTTLAILTSGFSGLDSSQWITGSKELVTWVIDGQQIQTPDLPGIALEKPYNRFLAAIVPTKDQLLGSRNLKPYQIDGAIAMQYLNLQKIFGKDRRFSSEHYNLCGPLAVMATVQRSPKVFFKTLANEDWAAHLLANGDEGIGILELEKIFRLYGWSTRVYPKFSVTSCRNVLPGDILEGQRLLCQAKQWLNDGKVIIINGNLLTGKKYGVLVPGDYEASTQSKGVAHWAALLQIIEGGDGFTYARIYNSFQNREEIYLWNDLYQTWYLDDGSFYSTLLASPFN